MSEAVVPQGPPRRLRLPGASFDRYLLRGYGPLVGLLVAFLLMAVFVPTVAAQKEVVQVSGGGSAAPGAAGGTATGATGTAGQAGSTGGPVTAGGGGGGGAAAGGVASSVAGAKVSACGGQKYQIPGDPYSPPCIAFSGNNGGATSPGVTATTINISYRVTSDATTFQQQLAALGGADFQDTEADIQRTIQGLADYFNTHFQFYGRKLNIEFFNGQGSLTNELLGQGQEQADADTAAQTEHAFAELNGVTEPYDDALYHQHVVAFGAPYLSAKWMGDRAPYEWSIATECNDVATTASEFGVKELGAESGQTKAIYAGGSLQGQPRKYAVIAPDNPWYQDCANAAIAYANAHGQPVTDDIQYQLDLATLSSQASSVISKLSNDGITTVYCGCDPIFPIYLTSRAHEQGYYPEWVVVGVALTDTDIVGQLFDQSEWSHAIGISYAGPTLPAQATLGYAAYKSVRSDEPAHEVDLIYAQMYEMAIGIQMAGPDLTPQTLEQGFRAYPGSIPNAPNAEFGTWLFPSGHYTPQIDSWIISWNPNKVSTYDNKQGAYQIDSQRYQNGQYPTGPPPVPQGFPYAPQH